MIGGLGGQREGVSFSEVRRVSDWAVGCSGGTRGNEEVMSGGVAPAPARPQEWGLACGGAEAKGGDELGSNTAQGPSRPPSR